jgi:hypothetical protein
MLQDLSRSQVEEALQQLWSPLKTPLPKELGELNEMEWFLLGRMLESLLVEKEHHPLQ